MLYQVTLLSRCEVQAKGNLQSNCKAEQSVQKLQSPTAHIFIHRVIVTRRLNQIAYINCKHSADGRQRMPSYCYASSYLPGWVQHVGLVHSPGMCRLL